MLNPGIFTAKYWWRGVYQGPDQVFENKKTEGDQVYIFSSMEYIRRYMGKDYMLQYSV